MEFKLTMEYLQKRPLSYSAMKFFQKSPKHYIHYITTPRKDPTPEMMLGSVVDCLLWTPDEFDKSYCVLPDLDRRTTKGKEEYKNILANSGSKKIISDYVERLAKVVVKELKNNEHVMRVLNKVTQAQKTVKWTDEETGLPLIAIYDGSGDKIIAELKTAKSAEPTQFAKDAYGLDYPLQCGMYMQGSNAKSFYYIVAEKEEPYGISVLKASDEYIEYGKKRLRFLLNEFKYCLDNNLFDRGYDYRYTNGYDYIELPPLAKPKISVL